MAKKKKRGHFCRECRRHRANEKFSGKGHQQHICKDCNKALQQKKRERKRANKKAIEAGLRPLRKRYPKTPYQAASYLQISVDDFLVACEQLQLNPCDFTDDWDDPVPIYDIDAMIAVWIHIRTRTETVDNLD
ncbi:MAG: hypothetical protein AAFR81_19280 [Chloroflexota bacterium]